MIYTFELFRCNSVPNTCTWVTVLFALSFKLLSFTRKMRVMIQWNDTCMKNSWNLQVFALLDKKELVLNEWLSVGYSILNSIYKKYFKVGNAAACPCILLICTHYLTRVSIYKIEKCIVNRERFIIEWTAVILW